MFLTSVPPFLVFMVSQSINATRVGVVLPANLSSKSVLTKAKSSLATLEIFLLKLL
nr:MAG TPA: hypothetical protein [Caudoviricetes sp.]